MSSLILGLAKMVLLLNIWFQFDYVSEYLEAAYSNQEYWAFYFENSTLDSLVHISRVGQIVYFCLDIYVIFFCFVSGRGFYLHLVSQIEGNSYLAFFSNFALMIFSTAACFTIQHSFFYEEYPILHTYNPSWVWHGLQITHLVIIGFTFLLWFCIYFKYRCPLFGSSVILLILAFILATFLGYGFRSIRTTRTYYMNNWVERMQLIDSRDLQSYGCPSKYLA